MPLPLTRLTREPKWCCPHAADTSRPPAEVGVAGQEQTEVRRADVCVLLQVLRNRKVIHQGKLTSLRRVKEQVLPFWPPVLLLEPCGVAAAVHASPAMYPLSCTHGHGNAVACSLQSCVLGAVTLRCADMLMPQVREIENGNECGVAVENFTDWRQGDKLEAIELVTKKRTLESARR